MTQLALRLLILTGVRTFPLCHIHKDQVDGDIWIIPVENMKGRRDATTEFHVLLSEGEFITVYFDVFFLRKYGNTLNNLKSLQYLAFFVVLDFSVSKEQIEAKEW